MDICYSVERDGSCAEANYLKFQQWRLTWPRNLWLYLDKYANTRICLKHILVLFASKVKFMYENFYLRQG